MDVFKQVEPIIFTGTTCLPGSLQLKKLSTVNPGGKVFCLVRPTSDTRHIQELDLNINYLTGDSSDVSTWTKILPKHSPKTIVHIASIRHIPAILESLEICQQTPHLIVIGTTGVYSKYNEFSATYKKIAAHLLEYRGSYCLLQPTMIYGSHRDKNLHKLIKFCDRYGFFPVFGSGDNLIQPVHAEDLAQAILTALQRPHIQGAYDLSGGTVVTFRDLLTLVGKLLGKPVRQISLPLNAGVWSATILENLLQERSPVRREQILRLQEDKAYPHDAAQRDLDFFPRTLEEGLRQEVELMRSLGMISS
ncbi:Male sterility domain-containing protein [Planktothricoides sp. SR001]|uniref:NAD-dependent epimerase/dehydratase family protein n=1 Tax=Planktothricoides sp. SR001 TaxID=1705388 RepID=UPI0006C5C988|nr:NAD-dependent epimerase/dehydratase family protein [Planktothricoides sp. SR001]KOR36668.1 Male sterility domain-containing protein [Planktothricoides sp. SR001]